MRYNLLLLFFSIHSFGLTSFAASRTVYQGSQTSPAWQRFFKEVELALPEKLANLGAITVELLPLSDLSSRSIEIDCDDSEGKPAQLLAHAIPHRSRPIIQIHPAFVPIIEKRDVRKRDFACGHQNLYRLALATLIHETIHIWDDRENVSTDPVFLERAGWSLQGALFKTFKKSNFQMARTPDPYERTNAREALAVNGEFFALDPEYMCRRPILAKYLLEKLGAAQTPPVACSSKVPLFVQDRGWIHLDLNRIYRVDYVLAGKGKGLQSQFGHTVLRLVICAPHRTQVDEQCVQDVGDHLAMGYVANLSDLKIDFIKGLTGKYDSQLGVSTWLSQLFRYNDGENREVEVYPFLLTPAGRDELVLSLIENFWEYQGKYRFISKNCAVDARRTIRTSLDYSVAQDLRANTPIGLLKELQRLGLVTQGPARTYDGARDKILALADAAGVPKIEIDQLMRKNAKSRAAFYQSLEGTAVEKRLVFVAIEIALKQLSDLEHEKEMTTQLQDCVDNAKKCAPSDRAKASEITSLLREQLAVSPWSVFDRYGIPFGPELTPQVQLAHERQEGGVNARLKRLGKVLFEKEILKHEAEQLTIAENLQRLVQGIFLTLEDNPFNGLSLKP